MNNNDNEPQAVVAALRRSGWRQEALDGRLKEQQQLFEEGLLTEIEHKRIVEKLIKRAGLFTLTGGGRRKTKRRKTKRRKTKRRKTQRRKTQRRKTQRRKTRHS